MTYRINAGELPEDHWFFSSDGGGRVIGEVCHFIDFLSRKESVYAFKLNASRLDIGSIDSYRKAEEALTLGENFF